MAILCRSAIPKSGHQRRPPAVQLSQVKFVNDDLADDDAVSYDRPNCNALSTSPQLTMLRLESMPKRSATGAVDPAS